MRSLAARQLRRDSLLLEPRLNRLEQIQIQNGLVPAPVDFATVDDLADVEAVLEEVGEGANAVAGGLDHPAVGKSPRLRSLILIIELGREPADRPD